MVYTLTANPSLDYLIELNRIKPGIMNRSKKERIVAGGKGLNVSIVLKSFGVESKAFGVVAGFTGDEWLRLVKEQGIDVEVVQLAAGNTRINVKLVGVEQTEINASGPVITPECKIQFIKLFDQIKDGDTLCISGNAAPGVASTIYAQIMDELSNRDVKIFVDASGDLMRNALPCHPYLIKPNLEELKDIGNTSIDSKEDIIGCCERLIRMGAQNVLVSLGKEGAIWVGQDGFKYEVSAPKGRVKNTVGSGDSMVAAFLYATLQDMPIEERIKLAVATGSAGAFSENLATKEGAYGILNKIEGHTI